MLSKKDRKLRINKSSGIKKGEYNNSEVENFTSVFKSLRQSHHFYLQFLSGSAMSERSCTVFSLSSSLSCLTEPQRAFSGYYTTGSELTSSFQIILWKYIQE